MLIQIEEPEEGGAGEGLAVGMDFGAISLRVALSIGGNGEVLGGAADETVPMLVTVTPEGRLVAGSIEPGRPVLDIRRLLGSGATVAAGGLIYSAADLAVELLELAKMRAERALGQAIGRAVATVPPEFDQMARLALLGALGRAGL
jgi:molecular chaperone HscC